MKVNSDHVLAVVMPLEAPAAFTQTDNKLRGTAASAAFAPDDSDWVVIDIEMPMRDGLSGTRAIREDPPPGAHRNHRAPRHARHPVQDRRGRCSHQEQP